MGEFQRLDEMPLWMGSKKRGEEARIPAIPSWWCVINIPLFFSILCTKITSVLTDPYIVFNGRSSTLGIGNTSTFSLKGILASISGTSIWKECGLWHQDRNWHSSPIFKNVDRVFTPDSWHMSSFTFLALWWEIWNKRGNIACKGGGHEVARLKGCFQFSGRDACFCPATENIGYLPAIWILPPSTSGALQHFPSVGYTCWEIASQPALLRLFTIA